MTAALAVQEISFSYPGKNIFSGLSFEAREASSTVILGASGTGKTTLLKLAAGILYPDSGRVLFQGTDFQNAPVSRQKSLYRGLGFLFQDTALIANLNIFDNLALPLKYHGDCPPEQIEPRVREALDRFDLASQAESLPAQISTGLKKRAALARALIRSPEILFLDDPLAETDQRFQDIIVQIARDCRRPKSMVLSTTSDFEGAARMGDRVLLLSQGKIVAEGSPPEVEQRACTLLKEKFA